MPFSNYSKLVKVHVLLNGSKDIHTSVGNNIADHYADKHGLDADRFSNTFKPPIHEGDSIKVVPLADDPVIEEDYRKSIKHRQQEQYGYQVLGNSKFTGILFNVAKNEVNCRLESHNSDPSWEPVYVLPIYSNFPLTF
jgi:hypothetical protein